MTGYAAQEAVTWMLLQNTLTVAGMTDICQVLGGVIENDQVLVVAGLRDGC